MRLLDKKIQKVLSLQTTKPEVLEALDSFSDFFVATDNAIDARKSMRLTLEGIGIDISKKFSSELQSFFQVFNNFSKSLQEVEETCDEIEHKLDTTWDEASLVYNHINETNEMTILMDTRRKKISEFLSKYSLSDAEEAIFLDEKILDDNNYEFFNIHNKTLTIRKSCDELLKDPYCILSCTVQLLERVSRQQEEAYKMLFAWTQKQLGQLTNSTYVQDNNDLKFLFFQKAFITLRERPSYFDHCLELLNNSRKTVITKKFNELQRTWKQSKKQGLYVSLISDLFASIHQIMGSEAEFYQSVLTNEKIGDETIANNNKDNNNNDVIMKNMNLLKKSLDIVFSGILSPLNDILEEAVMYETKVQDLFTLHQLLTFYCHSYERFLSLDGPLLTMLNQAEISIWDTICSLMSEKVSKSNYNTLLFSVDVSPLPVVQEFVSIMTSSLITFDTSLLESNKKTELFNQLAEATISPLLVVCQKSFRSIDSTETPIFMINTLEELRKLLVTYSFTVKWVMKCADELEYWMDKIIHEKVTGLLKQSNLLDAIQYLETKPKDQPLSAYPNASPLIIERGSQALVSKMYASIAPEYSKITAKVRERARLEASRSIADAYEKLYNAIHDPYNGYISPDNIMIHTPKQIRTLLDCDN
ncbi:hypothetical protein WA158_004425 [Blastocystis sp. Blastoise]